MFASPLCVIPAQAGISAGEENGGRSERGDQLTEIPAFAGMTAGGAAAGGERRA